MKRRSFFKLLAGAVMASAMEVCGWTGVPKFDPASYVGEIMWLNLPPELQQGVLNHLYNMMMYGRSELTVHEHGQITASRMT